MVPPVARLIGPTLDRLLVLLSAHLGGSLSVFLQHSRSAPVAASPTFLATARAYLNHDGALARLPYRRVRVLASGHLCAPRCGL